MNDFDSLFAKDPTLNVRPERSTDYSQIEALTLLAFQDKPYASGTEQYLAEKLRAKQALTLSLVVEKSNVIVGHIAVSPVKINDKLDACFGIGPLAVLPEVQGLGYGTQLLLDALEYLKSIDAKCCVLVGDPNFYSRVGFTVEKQLFYRDAPAEYFQSVWFCEERATGEVAFHDAFE